MNLKNSTRNTEFSNDAVLGQKSTESDNYYDDENEYEDDEKNDYKNNNETNNQIDYENESGIINTQYSVTYNKLKSQIMSKGTKTSAGKYMIVNLLTSELTVNLYYNPDEKYIGYMLIDLSDSERPVTSTLFLYEDSAPVAMLVSTGNVKATVIGEYNNSEIKIISSTYPSANTAAIKAINASYKIFDAVAELNDIDIKIKDFEINY